MMAEIKYSVRQATEADIPFLTQTIMEADKSGTDKLSYATLYGVSEADAKRNISSMLEEEIDDCDLSVSSFLIAEADGQPVAAFGSWVEGGRNDILPSGLLKSNLLGYTYGVEAMKRLAEKAPLLNGMLLEREPGTLQFESLFVAERHRGRGLGQMLVEEHIKWRRSQHPELKKAQVQLFSGNSAAKATYAKCGFVPVRTGKSGDAEILQYLGQDEKLLMEKAL
jgi:GNAT superfamily N-acetyltransferase